MLAPTRSPDIRWYVSRVAVALLVTAGAALLGACAPQRAPGAAAARPQVVTIPQLKEMLAQSSPVGVIYGKVQGSGTVYRLTPYQLADLQENRMPNELLSYIQLTYDHAIRQHPELATSNAHWTEIDGYWYGGLPYGWPREWIVGAPRPGELLR